MSRTDNSRPSLRFSRHAAFCLVLLAASQPSHASVDLPAICEAAAAEASQRTGVPLPVLMAISLNETGRKSEGRFRPWPWTVNMEGKGKWFDTPDEARAYVYKEFKRGARSFDVGCFQINYKWHYQHFSSIDQMFDPRANAMYAARYLGELYAEKGSWSKAAGAYHSRTPEKAERYATRFDTFLARMEGKTPPEEPVPYMAGAYGDDGRAGGYAGEGQDDIPEVPEAFLASLIEEPITEEPRVNTYPLLQASVGTGGMGSLVPITATASNGSLFPSPVVVD